MLVALMGSGRGVQSYRYSLEWAFANARPDGPTRPPWLETALFEETIEYRDILRQTRTKLLSATERGIDD